MSIKSTSISSARQQSVQSKSAGFIFVANAYAATGAAIGQSTDIKRYVVVPGQTETIQAIAGGDAPTISSIVVTDENWIPTGLNVIDNLTGGYIEINGTGFDAGTAVYLNGQSITTIFVNSTLLRVEVPPSAIGTYSLMIFTSTGAGVIYLNLDFSSTPAFITPAGSIGSFYELLPFSVNVQANADSVITYSVQSGSLPANVTLAANGVISGNAPAVMDSTIFSIVVLANDQENQQSTRSFNLTILPDLVTWYNPSSNVSYVLPTGFAMTETLGNITLNAQAVSNAAITYTANTLPSGITLNGNLLSGTPTTQGNILSLFTATANVTNKANTRLITFKIRNTFESNNYVPSFANCGLLGTGSSGTSGHYLSPDGTKYFVTNTSSEKVFQYSLESNNFSTLTYVSNLSIVANGLAASNPQTVYFKPDGTKMFVLTDPNTPWINEYALTQAWDITTAQFLSNLSVSSHSTISLDSITFANAGQRLYTLYSASVREWTLTTPWQINTATYSGRSLSLPSATSGITISEDGTTLWNGNTTQIQKRTFSTPFFINTATTISQSANTFPSQTPFISASIDPGEYWQVTADGTKIYAIAGSTSTKLPFLYNMLTANDLSTLQYPQLLGFYGYQAYGLRIGSNGSKFYAVQNVNNVLSEYNLSRTDEIGTATLVSNLAVLNSPTGVSFKSDGTRMFVSSATRINEYNLSTPWQTNNATLGGNLTVTTLCQDLDFSSNGARMYIINSSSRLILEYHLSTPWQLNTAVVVSNISVLSTDTAPTSLFFNTYGNTFFYSGQGTDSINQYNLSVPWQLNTASFIGNFTIGSIESGVQALCLNSIGTKLYFSGTGADYTWQWNLG